MFIFIGNENLAFKTITTGFKNAAIYTEIANSEGLKELSGFLNTFFVSQAAVVSVFMGATAYSKRNNDLSVQAK